MEALHTTSLAPSLSWKDSFSSSRANGKHCEQKQLRERKSGSGPCVISFQALKAESRSSISRATRDFALCTTTGPSGIRHLSVCQRRCSTGNHAVAGRASPSTTSDNEDETYVQPRVKLLQDAVGPNKTVLDAQARVCTGPSQTRPLDEAQAFKVLHAILQSGTLLLLTRICLFFFLFFFFFENEFN